MRRNQLPPHPVVNTLCQSSLRKITFQPVIIKFLSGPRLFFFFFQKFWMHVCFNIQWRQKVFEVPFFPPVCPTLKFEWYKKEIQELSSPLASKSYSTWSRFIPPFRSLLFSFSFFFFLFCFVFFLLLFCFYVGGSTCTRRIPTLFSLLFKEDRFVENARQHGAHKMDHSQNLSL